MSTRPNVLLIVTDQHRHDFVGYRGADWLSTPHIDRIAASGATFTHCVTNSPVCGPTRCGLATGKQPHRIGCLSNRDVLPLSHRTFYQQLRDHNYWTGFVGKLDLAKVPLDFPGGRRGMRPGGLSPEHFAFGFCQPVEIVADMAGAIDKDGLYGEYLQKHGWLAQWIEERHSRMPVPGVVAMSNLRPGHVDMRSGDIAPDWIRTVCRDFDLPTEAHIDVFIGSQAERWLEQTTPEDPWFLQVNFMGPHDPFDPPTEYAERYRNARIPDPIPAQYDGKPEWIRQRFMTDDIEQIRFSQRQYSACIAMIDDQVGRMLNLLERRGLLDNTVVIFTADHGEMLGDMGLYIKHVPYEKSIRVPLAVCGPGIPAGKSSDALVEWIDLNATICELTNTPGIERIDARSLGPVLRGEASEHRESALCCEYNFNSLRDRRWKFVQNHNDISELYDLETDPQELNNLASQSGAHVHEFARMCREMNRRMAEGGWLR